MNEGTMFVVQCPKCGAKYQSKEKPAGSRSEVKFRCAKCGFVFSAPPPRPAAPDPMAEAEATMVSRQVKQPALPADKKVTLSVVNGPLQGKVFAITKPKIVLGRTDADIVLDDPEVSRKHCALEVHAARAKLVDLGSRNGTFVNEEKVQTYELEHLSEFRIGQNTFLFTVTDKT